MAIERVWQSGWELNSGLSEITTLTSATTISNTAPKTGTYSLKIARSGPEGATLTLPTALTQLRIGFHAQIPKEWTSQKILSIFDAGTNVLYYLKTNGTMTGVGLYNGSDVQIGSNYLILPSTYFHFGFDIKKDASSGWIYFYIDGTLAASFDGNTGVTAIASIKWGNQSAGVDGLAYYDDMYVDNMSGEASPVPVPDERFNYRGLDGDGSYLEFSTYTGSVHYTLLDEIPPSGNDYVYSLTPGQRDSYTFSNYTLSSGETIEALIPLAVARKESAANILLGLGAGLSGTFSIGSFQTLPTSYGKNVFQRMTTNPFGADWSENDINNAQLYIMSSGTYT